MNYIAYNYEILYSTEKKMMSENRCHTDRIFISMAFKVTNMVSGNHQKFELKSYIDLRRTGNIYFKRCNDAIFGAMKRKKFSSCMHDH